MSSLYARRIAISEFIAKKLGYQSSDLTVSVIKDGKIGNNNAYRIKAINTKTLELVYLSERHTGGTVNFGYSESSMLWLGEMLSVDIAQKIESGEAVLKNK